MSISNPSKSLILACSFEMALGVLAVFLGFFGVNARAHMPPLTDSWGLFNGVAIGFLAVIPMFAFLVAIDWIPIRELRDLKTLVEETLLPLLDGFGWSEKLALCLCAGVGEELLFRGWIQQVLSPSHSPFDLANAWTWIAIATASLAFGLAHAINRMYFLLATCIGIYLSIIYCYTENLLVPIVAHAVYDWIAIAWLLRSRKTV